MKALAVAVLFIVVPAVRADVTTLKLPPNSIPDGKCGWKCAMGFKLEDGRCVPRQEFYLYNKTEGQIPGCMDARGRGDKIEFEMCSGRSCR